MAGQAGGNVNTYAAQGVKGAGMGTAQGMAYAPQQVQAGQLANTDMSQYMNPYTQQVIEANEADILRGANKGLDMLGAQATAGKAFGGSRHGVAMGEMGRDVAQQLAQSSAGLRQAGFQQAQQAAQSDIGTQMQASLANQQAGLQGAQQRLGASGQLADIANLGFGMGQQIQDRMQMQGSQQQALQQALIDAAKGQFQGHTGAPATGLSHLNQALGVTQAGQTQTNTKQPGLFDYLTLGAQVASSDKRMKKNITKMGQLKSGLNIYKWDWKEGAEKLGADMNHTIGVIAQEVEKIFPEAVITRDNGTLAVNYGMLR